MRSIFASIARSAIPLLSVAALAAPAHAQIVSGQVYTLVSKTSNQALDNNDDTLNPGIQTVQWGPAAGNTNQQWRINSLGAGKYSLINMTSGMALDNGGSTTIGSAVVQNVPSASSAAQQWTITSVGSGYYTLVCATGGLALDNGGTSTQGQTVVQKAVVSGSASQQWLISPVQIGAATPFISYEAEAGTLAGGATTVSLTSPPTTKFSSPQLEASGHSYVHLGGTGQSVQWTNNTGKNINFVNVRYSIPDSSGGGGITSTIDLYVNGTFRQALNVNSQQTWVYESDSSYDGMAQTPSSGSPHVFWDETHAFITGAAIAPGSTIMLKQGSSNTAGYYNIDVVDLEAPPAALTQPANSLSITSYGAVANNSGSDSTTAIQNCINDALSQGKSVWIPQGTFYMNSAARLAPTSVTIQGAGMWYSTIYYNPVLPVSSGNVEVFQPTSCTLKNFMIDGKATSQTHADGNCYAVNTKGSNWLLDSLWIQHEGPAVWADGTNGTVQNCRINNSWADGINLNNGNGATGNDSGSNLTAKNNFIRGSGDDGIAINNGPTPSQQMTNVTVLNNTVVAPWWANNIGVYGGTNDLVANNLCTDNVKEQGIGIGLFGSWAFMQDAKIQGNTVLRGGSFGYGNQYYAVGMGQAAGTSGALVTNVRLCGNTVGNAMFGGITLTPGTGLIVNGNTVNSPGQNAFVMDSGANGSASLICNTVSSLAAGKSAYVDNAPGANFTVTGYGNTPFIIPLRLVGRQSGLSLDVAGQLTTNGSAVDIWTSNSGLNQQWYLQPNGGSGYEIIGVQSGRALQVNGSLTANGSAVNIWDAGNAANQLWNLIATDSGYYRVMGVQSGRALDVAGQATAPGSSVDIWDWDGGANQQWKLATP